ncbi:MAG: hypothetical protein IJR54_04850 [Oscillibacter sp.]|nr:hypothetical protein [Oscillibacter sp.]
MVKRCWSFLLCFSLVCALIPLSAAAGVDSGDTITGELADTSYEVTGTNSVGKMLANLMGEQQEADAEMESRGYGVSGVVMDGSQAEVTYLCEDKACLMVAVYDEQTSQMTAIGVEEVEPNGEAVTISLSGTIPEFYIISAFILDSDTFAPLCEKYTTTLYTQPMQELLASTAQDYDEAQTLNLDGSADNNFLVYDESVTQLEKRAGVNDVSYQDGVCTIENASADTKSLRPGDIFSYRTDNDQILIIKVASVETVGNAVVITEDEDIDLEEVFSVIKIDSDAINAESARLMSDDGLEYSTSAEISIGKEISDETDHLKVMGSIRGSLGVNAKISLYHVKKYTQFEWKFTSKLNVKIGIEGRVSATIPLVDLPILFAPVPCVLVSIEPSFVVAATGKLEGQFELSASIGRTYETGVGWKDIDSSPKITKAEVNLEGTLFIGLSLEPEADVLYIDGKTIKGGLVSLKLTAKVGLEFKAKTSLVNGVKSSAHDCDFCVDGDINLKLELSGRIDSSLKILRVSGKIVDFSLRLGNFYFSIREGTATFGWGKCPYRKSGYVTIPDGATLFNGHAYKLYDKPMTWAEAKAACEFVGGHLATITTVSEQNLIANCLTVGLKNAYWLGGTDERQEGCWEWITGESWNYTNWSHTQPDNQNTENYLSICNRVFNSYYFAQWNDLQSNYETQGVYSLDNLGYICEWDTISPDPRLSSNPNLIRNWNFSLNSNGQVTYVNSGNNPFVESVDGWHPTPGQVEVISDGVRFSLNNSNDTAFFAYLMPESELEPLIGKTLTFSVIVDNVIYISTGVLEPGVIHSSLWKDTPWGVFRIHHYQSAVWNSQYAPTIDLYPNLASSIVIRAVKLEEGNTSTLLLDL